MAEVQLGGGGGGDTLHVTKRERESAPPWKIAPRLLLTRFFLVGEAALLALVKGAWTKERKEAYIRCTKRNSVLWVVLRGWVTSFLNVCR